MLVVPAQQKDLPIILKGIEELALDNREIFYSDFFVAKNKESQLCGFGRIRDYGQYGELCSLGVFESHQRRGIAHQLVNGLLLNYSKDLYVVTVIPDFFTPFGFIIVSTFPNKIQEKLQYCNSFLSVPENYYVMIKKHN